MCQLPKFVHINEEGPREGFQIEKGPIPTEKKIELIDSLSKTGLKQIQTVSFVPPQNVPGMADADEVVRGFTPHLGVSYTGLWLNERGLERAIVLGKLDIKGSIFLCASDAFLQKNQKRTMEENLQAQHTMIKMYKQRNIPVKTCGIMATFGCNFEGDIPIFKVLNLIKHLVDIDKQYELGIQSLMLADTMAWATPLAIKRVVGAVREKFPQFKIGLHLHDTRGMGISNAFAGLEMGVDLFDAAVGGLGGCPFASHKGAAGNVCTEDLVFMCHEMGIETGINLDLLIESAILAEKIVGHPLPGCVMRGGTLDQKRKMII